MARTSQPRRRRLGRSLALAVAASLLGAACSATPEWVPVESAEPATAVEAPPLADPATEPVDSGNAPAELAFIEEEAAEEVVELDLASTELCEATANSWIHSAALNLIGPEANPEMNQVALANVAEWLERATLYVEDNGVDRAEMFGAFQELQLAVGEDFGHDWTSFQSSTAYANDPAAQTYEAARSALVPFMNEKCEDIEISDLANQAEARADELIAGFGTSPSTVVESDSLPGHSIFTHSSGRLIASFPSAWSYEENRNADAVVDLIASPKIDRFLANEAVDGIRMQLVEAATLDAFRDLIDATMVGSSCTRTNDLMDTGVTRLNITQTFDCPDHGASIVGQYNSDRGLGLVLEASFDRPNASRADLIRLASIANSALWS